MKHLWAPWRLTYIKNHVSAPCFFCAYLRQSASKDRENLVFFRGKTCFCVLNRFPYNPGHLMVAPKKHKGKLERLTAKELDELFVLTRNMQVLLTQKLKPHGFNIGINLGRAAGAGVLGHLHVHIVPRWSGDTNFMPIVGKTKVMPQTLMELYDELRGAIAAKGKRKTLASKK